MIPRLSEGADNAAPRDGLPSRNPNIEKHPHTTRHNKRERGSSDRNCQWSGSKRGSFQLRPLSWSFCQEPIDFPQADFPDHGHSLMQLRLLNSHSSSDSDIVSIGHSSSGFGLSYVTLHRHWALRQQSPAPQPCRPAWTFSISSLVSNGDD